MLASWKKSYDQPRQHIKKQRHYFASKGPASQSYGFFSSHVWMWELDHKKSWALKNWCFWTVVLKETLTARRSNQSTLKEISPEYTLERLMLKLKLQYSGHLMWRTDSLEKTRMLGKIEGRRRRGRQRMRWLDGINDNAWIVSFSWISTERALFFSGNYLIPCSFSRNSGEGDNSEFDLCDTKKQVLLYGLSLVMTQWILKIYDTVELH